MASKPTIVIDTNIWVAAAFNPQSSSAQIVRRVRDGRYRLVWNPFTRDESRAVVQQIPPLRHKHAWDNFAPLFRDENCYDGQTQPQAQQPVPDNADRQFAALAAATDATLISNDDDFLGVRQQLAITVQTPSEFLAAHES